MAIIPAGSALSEIEGRLTQIHNEQQFLRGEITGFRAEIARAEDRLILLDRIETDYVALLAPQQEGIPA